MFGFLFKFLVLPVILLLVAVAGIAAFLLLTPVSDNNVKSRLWQACMLTSALQSANNSGRSAATPVYSSAQCTCAGNSVVDTMGVNAAAKGADTARRFIVDGIRGWISGGNFRELKNAPEAQTAEQFVMAAKQLSRRCSDQH